MKRIIAIFFSFYFSALPLCADSDSNLHGSTSQGGAGASQAQNSQGRQKLLSDLLLKSVLQTHKEVMDDLALKLHDHSSPARILLFGQSGIGKTTVARASAQLLNKPVVLINAATVSLSPTGATNFMHSIAECFQKNEPCTVIIDDLDLLPSTVSVDVYNFLAGLIDSFGVDSRVGLICVANRPAILPDELKHKLSPQNMSLPDVATREHVFNYYLTHTPGVKNSCSVNEMRSLANDSDGFSIRDLENIVLDARQKTYVRKTASAMVTVSVLRGMARKVRELKPKVNTPSVFSTLSGKIIRGAAETAGGYGAKYVYDNGWVGTAGRWGAGVAEGACKKGWFGTFGFWVLDKVKGTAVTAVKKAPQFAVYTSKILFSKHF